VVIKEKLKSEMIALAKKTYGDLYVIRNRKSFEDSFTVQNQRITFWFNTNNHSTHTITYDTAIPDGGINIAL